jgi:hypothetical protein
LTHVGWFEGVRICSFIVSTGGGALAKRAQNVMMRIGMLTFRVYGTGETTISFPFQ